MPRLVVVNFLMSRAWRFARRFTGSRRVAVAGAFGIGALVLWPISLLVILADLLNLAVRRRFVATPLPATWAASFGVVFVLLSVVSPAASTPTSAPGPTPVPTLIAKATPASTPTPRPTSTPAATPTQRPPSPTPSLATPEPSLGTAPIGPTETAVVVRVVDGDTIVINRGRGEEKLRYIGMDTPETVDTASPVQWMGPQATAANKALVEGQHVVLERDVSETDQYGRLLRYVWLAKATGWLLVNLELVVEGVAQVATYPPDVRYVDFYVAAERAAQEQGIGLWGATPPPTKAPTPAPKIQPTPEPAGQCHPSYLDACLLVGIGDYDCAGGKGNGPNYVQNRVRVVGPDEFGLDSDGDGFGCDSLPG